MRLKLQIASMIVAAILLQGCESPKHADPISPQAAAVGPVSKPTVTLKEPEAKPSSPAIQKMSIVFGGNYTQTQIRSSLDRAFDLYGLPKTEDNYSRIGSVLISLNQKFPNQSEMRILDYAIRSFAPNVKVHLVDMLAMSAVALESGDR